MSRNSILLIFAFFLFAFSFESVKAAPADSAVEDFIALGLELGKSDAFKRLETSANYQIFSQPHSVNAAFIEALSKDPSEEKLMALAEILGQNEANSVKSIEAYLEVVAKDPDLKASIENSLHWFEERLKSKRVDAGAFTSRFYEIGMMSVTYAGLLYSISGYCPEVIQYGSAMTTSYMPFITLFAVAAQREYLGMKDGLKSYFRLLREMRTTKRFIKDFRANLEAVKRIGNDSALAIAIEAAKFSFINQESRAAARVLVDQYVHSLNALKKAGVLQKFISFMNSRRMRKQLSALMRAGAAADPNFVKQLGPEETLIINHRSTAEWVVEYSVYKDEIRSWLVANVDNQLLDLEEKTREHLREMDLAAVERSKLRWWESISLKTLSIGSAAVGMALSIGSSRVELFDQYIPKDIIEFTLNNRELISVSALFVPAFTLLYIEGSVIFSSVLKYARASVQYRERKKRESLLRFLESIELFKDEREKVFANSKTTFAHEVVPTAELTTQQVVEYVVDGKRLPRELRCQDIFR